MEYICNNIMNPYTTLFLLVFLLLLVFMRPTTIEKYAQQNISGGNQIKPPSTTDMKELLEYILGNQQPLIDRLPDKFI